jgi:hypothetical protein
MRITYCILIVVLSFLALGASTQEDPFYPEAVQRCLDDSSVKGHVDVVADHNPLYLRGDFDGDGRPDYALEVRKPKARVSGILVCPGSGRPALLGKAVAGGAVFSDMPGDNFVAPHWAVLTHSEIVELTKFSSNVPKPIPEAKGEGIAMVWEDGISVIYWNGTRFRWAGARQ